ncbi:hypothetical protein CONLIGDRAFT_650056 [Coniochaeta ligniaria NRRL 30616]|uniref:Zn(2)-C6 fungal-type domain-containing protein n=1 Tax=Coniochaeta ligniaria NRRL 30616 TaxID=1408157 RepID=A0A1J7J619_9PEZI|nr:hypothetical protein CONLIGDRAFT_650056 [Coniochaeta ligniaria NRRL 30616]
MPRQNLTANACTVCRKKRTKCDGRQPCRRCVSRGEDCVYEDKMWRTKDHLRSEIERLRKEVLQCQGLIRAFTIGGTAEEWKTIQSRMHRGEPPERIVAWIASSRSPASPPQNEVSPEQTVSPENSHPSISSQSNSLPETGNYSYASPEATTSLQSSPEDTYINIAPDLVSPARSGHSKGSVGRTASYPQSGSSHDRPITPQSLRSWTGATKDIELLHRLLHHYFDNCFPDFSFICKERFMGDLDEGTGVYCSAALLNAILGLASQSYNASSNSETESCSTSQFLAQANELLKTDKARLGITDIQATGILALAEANVGNDEAAFQLATNCVRKAVLLKTKMDSASVQIDDPVQLEALATTFCGAFSLVRIFRVMTGRLSCQTGPLFMRITPDNDDTAIDSPAARVERGVVLQQHFFAQLDRCPELLRFISTVTEIAHTICSYHHDDGVTPADLIPAYDKCLQAWGLFNNWLRNSSETNKDVLFAQIWYNYILTVLLSTIIDSSIDLRDGITPEAVVIQASESIIFLAGVYQEQCGFVFVHPFLPHMLFAATLVQLRRPFGTSGEQQHMPKAGDKRKTQSEPQASVAGTLNPLGDVEPNVSPRRHSLAHAPRAAALVLPSWKQHVAPTTMSQAVVTNDINDADDNNAVSAYEWPSQPASKLAAEGTLHLTKIGITNRKAAELAKALRARAAARPSAPALTMTGPVSEWTPGWETVNWGLSSGMDAGFGGLPIDSLQGFSAMTSHPPGGLGSVIPTAAPGYMVGDGVPCVAGDQVFPKCVEDSSRSSYGGLYAYPNPVPSFGEFALSAMDGVRIGSFAGGMASQGEGADNLA